MHGQGVRHVSRHAAALLPTLPHTCLARAQAAIAPRPSGPDCPPTGGDGFTYEHLADREELWFDFVADTGDGGDPTYA